MEEMKSTLDKSLIEVNSQPSKGEERLKALSWRPTLSPQLYQPLQLEFPAYVPDVFSVSNGYAAVIHEAVCE